jgi:hypothetical protein
MLRETRRKTSEELDAAGFIVLVVVVGLPLPSGQMGAPSSGKAGCPATHGLRFVLYSTVPLQQRRRS